MNSASILVKTDPQLKEKAQKTADAMGMERSHLYRKMRQFELITESDKGAEEEKLNENIS